MKKFPPGLIVLVTAGPHISAALAHPGHSLSGADESTLFHYLAEPVHALPILSLIIAVILIEWLCRGLRRRTTRH